MLYSNVVLVQIYTHDSATSLENSILVACLVEAVLLNFNRECKR